MYLDANNLHGWTMSQKLPQKMVLNKQKILLILMKLNLNVNLLLNLMNVFIKNCDKDSDKGYIIEVDV